MDDFWVEVSEDSLSEFTLAELVELENIYREVGEQSLGQEFCQDVATSFSGSISRAGKSAITWKQVQSWFLSKQEELQDKVTSSSSALKLFVDPSDTPNSSNAAENFQIPKGKKITDHSELPYEAKSSKDITDHSELRYEVKSAKVTDLSEFRYEAKSAKDITDLSELRYEAKSAKDNAWYDVASFLTYRVVCTGELEARVRYSGFRKEEDEWVNVKRALRDRSIPLEPSECHKVKVGDLVLCFQEREDHAVYCDAYVLEIQKRLHDARDCDCTFTVRYDHDNTKEEGIQLGRLCCRPTQYDPQTAFDMQAGLTPYVPQQPTFTIRPGIKFPF